MSSATENGRISLKDRLQRKWYLDAMATLRRHYNSLSDYDRRVFNDLDAAERMVGLDTMTITRRQMNHIKQSAFEYERGA